MEDLPNHYKNIIERAVLAGIIAEENKHIYISANCEDDDSELSEIEKRLNKEKDNSYSRYKPKNKCVNKASVTNSGRNFGGNKSLEMASFYSNDNKSITSGSTVKNYNISNTKHSNYGSDITDESTSYDYSIRQQNKISDSTQDMKSTRAFSKVSKKPIKEQIIDFNVPIYISLKQKKCAMKPDALNFAYGTQCELSRTCNSEQDSVKLKANDKLRNINKWTLRKAKFTVPKQEEKNIMNFADTSTFTDCINESLLEHTEHKCHIKGESIQNKALSFSAETEIPEHQKQNLALISKYLENESDKDTRNFDCTTRAINTRRRLKLRNDLINARPKHKTKENYLEGSKVLHDDKNSKTKRELYKPSNRDKCKRCNCSFNCQSGYVEGLNDIKAAERSNEDMNSLKGISMEKHTCGKDYGRQLNVNIVCQFYNNNNDDDDDVVKIGVVQDSQTVNGDSKVPVKKTEASQENIPESEKVKKKNKIQHLSRLFSNMKTKRKPNQLE